MKSNKNEKSKLNINQLLKKYECKKAKKDFETKKEMYLKQTDRNYKDGDRN